MKKSFYDVLKSDVPVIMDGAMGTELFARGLAVGENPELKNVTDPNLVRSVHADYAAAGAEIIYTNTFGANSEKLPDGASSDKIIRIAVENARAAAKDALIALDIGPVGRLTEPAGTLKFDEAYDIFRRQAVAGEKAGCDLVALETFSSLQELRAAVLAVKENTALPVLATMTFEENGRTFTGTPPSAFALTIGGLGSDALGVNCSRGPKALLEVLREIEAYTDLPVVAKPNAGLPDSFGRYDLNAEEFAVQCVKLVESGVKLIGGCCGTSPAYIAALSSALKGVKVGSRAKRVKALALCSDRKTVLADRPLIVGERLNPTGKKQLKEAYLSGDTGYVTARAAEQEEAGASLLDVNTGVPGADEAELMKTAVTAVNGVSGLPLSIDSSDPAALEAGLRAFPGKALVNSVNGEEESLKTVLPVVEKYGAAVIGLCLDEKGVPASSGRRVEIAAKIIAAAEKAGISRENIVIDCLTLTVSAEQAQAAETLSAVSEVKRRFGVKTALWVSNVSFGLPDRDRISSAFLIGALGAGLDFAIMNPNSAAMAYAFRAYMVLSGFDKGAAEYISACTDADKAASLGLTAFSPADKMSSAEEKSGPDGEKNRFTRLIIKGIGSVGAETAELLKAYSPLEVVNGFLIPALDEAGRLFEAGKLYLPQLIAAAEAAKLGFAEVKRVIEANGEKGISKGTIVLATVKGDVHDIGKNIVKVVLENYGYRVLDLGKNAEIDAVADAVVKNDIKLLGLSALMTTTVVNMEKTIKAVRAAAPDCKIMVGGAVLTQAYAQKIGADYYAKDANASVRIAKEVFASFDNA